MSESFTELNDGKFIVITLNGEYYGVPVPQVISIEKPTQITRVPNTLPFIQGVMNLRGLVIPVIDLHRKFEFEESEMNESSRLVIVNVDEIQVALIVDSAKDVIDIPADQIENTPEVGGGVHAKYIYGLAKISDGLMVLLNLDKVLKDDDIEAIKSIEA